MMPGLVWLQLIPLFGQIWQFFVVVWISRSLRKEFASPDEDSILGLSGVAAAELGKNPTLVMGIIYCTCSALGISMQFFRQYLEAAGIGALLDLGGMICWIIYWVQLAGYKRKLVQMGF